MSVLELKVQRGLVWSGPAMIGILLVGFGFIAGYIPPQPPTLPPETLVGVYAEDVNAIKVGMVLSMLASALLVPWGVAISGQLKQIDGAKALADVQMASCALVSLEFITPIGVWMAASYRADETLPQVTRAFHDLGWLLFMTVIWSFWVQLVCIAVAVLLDRRERPILPRWIGYLNLWVAVLITPGAIVLFFKSGPFAWNGIVGFFCPLAGFILWFCPMAVVMHKNLTRQIAEGENATPVLSRV